MKTLKFIISHINILRLFYSIVILSVLSMCVGIVGYIFYVLLFFVIDIHFQFTSFIFLIPLVGIITVYIYQTIGQSVAAGNQLLFKAYYQLKCRWSFIMTPLIVLTTSLSHLVGLSIGREGTAMQMGAGIFSIPVNLFNIRPFEKKMLLLIGVATGFSAVFGTPIAATFFAIEFFKVKGYKKWWLWIPILFFSTIAHLTSNYLGVKHWSTPEIHFIQTFQSIDVVYYTCAAILFFIASIFILWIFKFVHKIFRMIENPYTRVLIGSFILLLLFLFNGWEAYRSLGIPMIVDSFYHLQPHDASLIKMGLTAIAVGVGFRGGEVTPLFFIGALLGNLLSIILPLELVTLVAMGMLFIFGRCTLTPLATCFLAYELFGIQMVILILPFIFLSSFFFKKYTIYQ